MHDRRRVLRLLVLLLVAWIVLDFALTVEGAFHFNTDESLVWGRSTVALAPALSGVSLASRDAVSDAVTAETRPRGPRVVVAPLPHAVPRSRLAAAADPGSATDDH